MAPAQPAHSRRTRLSSLGDPTEGNEKSGQGHNHGRPALPSEWQPEDLLQEVNDRLAENKDLDDNPNVGTRGTRYLEK